MTRLGLIAVVLLGLAARAPATSLVPPASYKVTSPDGRYVFVMLEPIPMEEELKLWARPQAEQIRELRQTYKTSGLYLNDGSTTPLWTVDWFAADVLVASDGIHLVRRGGPTSLGSSDAVTFYARGKELRKYTVDDLIPGYESLPRISAQGEWRAEDAFDDAALRYTVKTLRGRRYVFDVATGEMLESSGVGRWPWVGAALALVVVGGGLGAWYWRKAARRGDG